MEDWFIQWGFPIFVALIGSLVQGVLGFGSGLICMAILPLIWEISYAVGVLNPLGLVLTILLTVKLRHHIQFKDTLPLLLAAPFGVVCGLWVLQSWPDALMKALLGALLLLFVAYSLLKSDKIHTLHPSLGMVAGFIGGATGAAFGTAGPPALIYASAAGWERDRFRANLQLFFTLTCVLAFLGLVRAEIVNPTTLPHTAILVPGVVVGVLVGNKLAQKIPAELFRNGVLGALSVMGVAYIGQWMGT